MSQWITHRRPTPEDADTCGNVFVPCERRTKLDVPGENFRYMPYGTVALGARWWPNNEEAVKAAAAERAAAAAANPDPTPEPTSEPAAEPSPAVAGVPSDQELWEVQLEACKQAEPWMTWLEWNPDHGCSPSTLAAHRALYDHGYRRCLEEAKATWELNNGPASDLTLLQKANAELASDLTALQEENAQLKEHNTQLDRGIEALNREVTNKYHDFTQLEVRQKETQHVLDSIAMRSGKLEQEKAQLKSKINELQQENAELRSEVKDLLHRRSQPQMVVIGDLEGELKRRDGEVKLEPESEPTPAPEPASFEPFSCGGCRWYSDSNSETGLCCRYAPTHKGFPRVAVEGWCGDFTESTHKGNH